MKKQLSVLLFFSMSMASYSGILELLTSSTLQVKGYAELKRISNTGKVYKTLNYQFDCYYLKDYIFLKTTTDRGVIVREDNLKDELHSYWGKGFDDFYTNYYPYRMTLEKNQYHPFGFIDIYNSRKNEPDVSLTERTVKKTGERQVTLSSPSTPYTQTILAKGLLHAKFDKDVLKSISTETVFTEIGFSAPIVEKVFDVNILDYFKSDSSLTSVPCSLISICYQLDRPANIPKPDSRQEITFTIKSAVSNPVLSPDAIRRLLTSDLKKLDAPSK